MNQVYLWMMNHHCIPEINPTWPCCVILLIIVLLILYYYYVLLYYYYCIIILNLLIVYWGFLHVHQRYWHVIFFFVVWEILSWYQHSLQGKVVLSVPACSAPCKQCDLWWASLSFLSRNSFLELWPASNT